MTEALSWIAAILGLVAVGCGVASFVFYRRAAQIRRDLERRR